MNEAAHTISLILPSKSSSNFNTSNSDPTSFVLNEGETSFASGMERDRSDLSRSIRHQEIVEPQPGNFGSMDCAPCFLSFSSNTPFYKLTIEAGSQLRTFAPIATAHLYSSLGTRVTRHFQARAPSRNSKKYRADGRCVNLVCEYFCLMLGDHRYVRN